MRWSKEGVNVKLIGVDEYGTQLTVTCSTLKGVAMRDCLAWAKVLLITCILLWLTPTYRPTGTAGHQEQVYYATFTRPSLSVEGLVPRLSALYMLLACTITRHPQNPSHMWTSLTSIMQLLHNNHEQIKRMRKQCVPGVLSHPFLNAWVRG